jgi:hypothetical protein
MGEVKVMEEGVMIVEGNGGNSAATSAVMNAVMNAVMSAVMIAEMSAEMSVAMIVVLSAETLMRTKGLRGTGPVVLGVDTKSQDREIFPQQIGKSLH